MKVEGGARADTWPTEDRVIQPYVAEAFPDGIPDAGVTVKTLAIERTFWEKATILHAEYHRPAERATPDRFSRHYADTAALAKHPTASNAVYQHDLRRRVVEWRSQFFGSSWANYDLAKPGTFRIVPPSHRLTALRRDFRSMRDMYLTEPASFDEILTTLADLENRINRAASG